MRNFLWTIIAVVAFGCSSDDEDQSEAKQIFSDQRRATVKPEAHPYVLNMQNQCTAFVLDVEKRLGMTADHCAPELGGKIFWGSPNLRDQTAPAVGTIVRMIETSLSAELDYVIFEFDLAGPTPAGMKAVKLAKNDQLEGAFAKKTPLAMIGYPADRYQNRNLTRSDCRVRSAKIEEDRSMDSFSQQMIAAWKSRGMTSHPQYEAMRAECYFISDRDGLARPAFVTDCSVYGGNSGGPVVVAETGVVVGMPATYLPEKPVQSGCYTKYWDTFFRPVTGRPMPQATASPNWDKLNRNDPTLTDFPTAIPMHMIAQRSAFLKANPQYLAEDALAKPADQPPPPDADVYALLGLEAPGAPGTYALHVSVKAAAGLTVTVTAADSGRILATVAGAERSGRRLFTARDPIDPAAGARTYSVAAKDSSGRLVSKRTFRFDSR